VPSYTVGYIDVYRNGVRLVSTDFTATTGTTVVLVNACTSGDSVVTESFLVSSVLNAIPATAASISSTYLASNLTITTPTIDTITSAASTALTLKSAGTNGVIIDTSQNLAFNSGYGSVATAYGCRAWVNFNGTGTVAIRASGNVSSITDNGTGDYTVNFTNAMPNINYCSLATGTGNEGLSIDGYANLRDTSTNKLVGSVRVQEVLQSGSPYDTPNMNVAIFR
jgi:hypothetical protein